MHVKKFWSIHALVVLFMLSIFASPAQARGGFLSYSQLLCHTAGFTCMKVKRGESWSSLWPDEDERDLVMRVNRTNMALRPGVTIAVPIDLSQSSLMDLAPFPLYLSPSPGEKVLIYDPALLAWAAYDASGKLVNWGPGSSGRDYCPDTGKACRTRVGTFRMQHTRGANCVSSIFPLPNGGAPMPYCMFFNNGQAFHGGPNEVPGFNASHGCVRVYVEDARWMYDDFVDMPGSGRKGTKVIIRPYPGENLSLNGLDTDRDTTAEDLASEGDGNYMRDHRAADDKIALEDDDYGPPEDTSYSPGDDASTNESTLDTDN